jgi:hypothetical protein
VLRQIALAPTGRILFFSLSCHVQCVFWHLHPRERPGTVLRRRSSAGRPFHLLKSHRSKFVLGVPCTLTPQTQASTCCPQKHVIESNRLGHALSWRRNVLANERTLSLGYLCTAFNIDLPSARGGEGNIPNLRPPWWVLRPLRCHHP